MKKNWRRNLSIWMLEDDDRRVAGSAGLEEVEGFMVYGLIVYGLIVYGLIGLWV